MNDAARRERLFRRYVETPFVGYAGSKNTLRTKRTRNTIECRINPSTLWLLRAGTALFGPGLTLLLFVLGARIESGATPWPIAAFLVFFSGVGWWYFLRSWLRVHRFELSIVDRTLALYASRRGEPVLVLQAEEIVALERFTKAYRGDDGPAVENLGIQLVAADGEKLALCASPDASVIERLERELAEHLDAARRPSTSYPATLRERAEERIENHRGSRGRS